MKQKIGAWSLAVCSAAWVISGCSNAASVGKDTCIGENIVCATDIEVRGYVLRSHNWPDGIETADVQTVTPEPFYLPEAKPQSLALLALGPDQSLWSAVREQGSVLVERISREGELIESRRVSVPRKTKSGPLPDVTLEVDAKLQPLLWLHYELAGTSSSDQMLLFDKTLDAVPTRFEIEKLHAAEFVVGVARTLSGGVVIRGALPADSGSTFDGFVEELDAQGKVVWRQTALKNEQLNLEKRGIVTPITALASGGATTGRLDGFLDLDQDGNAVEAGRFLGPSLGWFQKMLVTEDGRRIVAGTTSAEFGLGGDLAIVRFSPGSPEQSTYHDSWLLARQGYTDLSASALSIDSRGDVLVATEWGERLSSSEHRLICRLSHEHERDACFQVSSRNGGLPLPFESLVSLEPGVIIVSSADGLERIELP